MPGFSGQYRRDPPAQEFPWSWYFMRAGDFMEKTGKPRGEGEGLADPTAQVF